MIGNGCNIHHSALFGCLSFRASCGMLTSYCRFDFINSHAQAISQLS
jgi:hypothetical protein